MKLPPVAAKLLKKGAGAPASVGVGRLAKWPRSTWYAIISLLLVLGVASSAVDLLARSEKERAYAEQSKQRLVFAGEQGEAGSTASPKATDDGFEVDDEESPEERKLRDAEKKTAEPEAQSAEPVAADADAPKEDAKEKTKEDTAPAAEQEAAPAESSAVSEDTAPEPVATPEPVTETAPATSTMSEGEAALSDAPPPAVPDVARSETSLIFAPAREVSKETKAGSLPVVGDKGVRPFDIYHRTYRPVEDKAMLAIVITGMGFSAQSMNLVMALPPEVTVSFSPYAPDLAARIDTLRNGGHETWFDVPVQTANYPAYDPGPLGLMTMLGVSDRDNRIERMLIATRGAVGAIFPADDVIKDTAPAFDGIVKKIQQHGLEVFYGSANAPKVAGKMLKHPSYSLLASNSPTKLTSELNSISQKLSAETPVILYAQGSPHVLAAIRDWLPSLKNAPVSLAPLSAFYLDFAAIAAEEAAAEENAGKDEKKGGH